MKRPKPPILEPKTMAEATRLSAWAMGQAAAGNISAPMANAIGASCRTFVRLFESSAEKQIAALLAVMELQHKAISAAQRGDHDQVLTILTRVRELLATLPGRTPSDEGEPAPRTVIRTQVGRMTLDADPDAGEGDDDEATDP